MTHLTDVRVAVALKQLQSQVAPVARQLFSLATYHCICWRRDLAKFHTMRRNDANIVKQALRYTPQGHRGKGRRKHT